MNTTIRRTLRTDFDELDQLDLLVREICIAAGFDEELSAGFQLCASESVTNAMLHGNKMDETKQVFITAEVNSGRVVFSVEDQGAGFNPSDVPNPLAEENLLKTSGRGLFLMRTYCQDVNFEKNGSRIVLTFVSGQPE
jgi:serine/threonine-protein kinase RsbW